MGEVCWESVRVLPSEETVSIHGTHLGHRHLEMGRSRYCINLVAIAGHAGGAAPSAQEAHVLSDTNGYASNTRDESADNHCANADSRPKLRENSNYTYGLKPISGQDIPEEIRVAGGGKPVKISAEAAQASDNAGLVPTRQITHFSWGEEDQQVSIYVEVEGEPEAVVAAGDGKNGKVEVDFTSRSASLLI